MPKFSKKSELELATAHRDLQVLFQEVIKYIDCIVLEGYRGKEQQDQAFKEGNSRLQWPNGKHNAFPSKAVDVAPFPLDWKNISRFYWFAGFVKGVSEILLQKGEITHSIRFGGDWNRNYDITDEKGLRDLVHFELVE